VFLPIIDLNLCPKLEGKYELTITHAEYVTGVYENEFNDGTFM
jgi:hypothetical protein